MSYPSDEVGNHLFDEDLLDEKGVNPWSDVLDEAKYRELFGYEKHPFTGVDYVEYYGDLFRAEGCEPVFLFGNDVRAVLPYTKNVLCCDIHTRERSRRRLLAAGAEKVLLLSDIMTAPVNGSGYNEQFGLLGSNKATEESVKLFPRDCQQLCGRACTEPAQRHRQTRSRSWCTATAPSRTPWARSGSWPTLWSAPPIPAAWRASPMS